MQVDRERGSRGRGQDHAGSVGEKRREVAPHDLRRWPPERVGLRRGSGAAAASKLGPKEPRHIAGEEESAQDRVERLRGYLCAGHRRDRLGGCICLLSRESALLDRKVGCIAGDEDVSRSTRATVAVGW